MFIFTSILLYHVLQNRNAYFVIISIFLRQIRLCNLIFLVFWSMMRHCLQKCCPYSNTKGRIILFPCYSVCYKYNAGIVIFIWMNGLEMSYVIYKNKCYNAILFLTANERKQEKVRTIDGRKYILHLITKCFNSQ